ncbi:hypothetical protein JMM63_04005 [Rhodovulum sulfidophilum]|uniref:hypothetical protein n=1 Tax=Rhodovulum sulfidophilum TaxID=35806 RepID=UPI001923963C|nr:hypothetical protein [Rhodovulum sulfidophilum]MBL3594743.1 hypothetical protein [Rhodovulum sulfidophilum]
MTATGPKEAERLGLTRDHRGMASPCVRGAIPQERERSFRAGEYAQSTPTTEVCPVAARLDLDRPYAAGRRGNANKDLQPLPPAEGAVLSDQSSAVTADTNAGSVDQSKVGGMHETSAPFPIKPLEHS